MPEAEEVISEANAASRETAPESETEAANEAVYGDPSLTKPTVMVVDDDDNTAHTIGRIAEREGCKVIYEIDTYRAVSHIPVIKPFLVFVNYIEGDQYFLRACQLAHSVNSAVIVMQENPQRQDVVFACQVGAFDFLVKPMTLEYGTDKVIRGLAYVKTVLQRFYSQRAEINQNDKMNMREKVNKIAEQVQHLMALPQATLKVVQLCVNPRVNTDDLVAAVRVDAAITAALILRANSVAYGSKQRATTIREAIVRLGYRRVHSICVLISVFQMANAQSTSFVFDRFGHWVHSLGVGIIAEQLAHAHHSLNPEEYFLAGVLHDIGKLFFDDAMHEEYMVINRKCQLEHKRIGTEEKQHFSLHHAEMGHQLAKYWKLPDRVSQAITMHHDTKSFDEKEDLFGSLYIANLLSAAMLLGRTNDFYDAFINNSTWEKFGLPHAQWPRFFQQVNTQLRELLQLLKVPTGRLSFSRNILKDKGWVLLRDGGKTDVILELFLHFIGLQVLHDQQEAPAEPSSAAICDLRNCEPGDVEDIASLINVPIAVIKKSKDQLPSFIPEEAKVFSTPFDFLALLDVLR